MNREAPESYTRLSRATFRTLHGLLALSVPQKTDESAADFSFSAADLLFERPESFGESIQRHGDSNSFLNSWEDNQQRALA